MPNIQVVFYGANTSTILSSGGATATIKTTGGITVDTQTVLGVGTTTGSITSNNLATGNQYYITFTGSGAPAGTFNLFTPPLYADNNSNANANLVYTVLIDSNSITTTAPASAILPSPNPAIQTAFITFYNAAAASTLPAGITCTIAPSGGGATVDTQVTNALGQITSTKLLEAPSYQVTFTGTGAPTGTFIMDPVGNQINTIIV